MADFRGTLKATSQARSSFHHFLPAPGTIGVAARRAGHLLRVEVSNPRPDASAPPHQGQKLAVDNIAQRLALIYGEQQARLELGADGDRFVSRLILPIVSKAS